jgi:hypothetical protein
MNAPFSGSSMSHRDSTSLSVELNQHGKRVQELIAEIDGITDANARELLQECIQEVLAFHGLGLGRVLEVAKDASGGEDVYEKLVDDKLAFVRRSKRCGPTWKVTAEMWNCLVWITMLRAYN